MCHVYKLIVEDYNGFRGDVNLVTCAVLELEETFILISSQGSQDPVWTCPLLFRQMTFCLGCFSLNMKRHIYWYGSNETSAKMLQLADIFTLLFWPERFLSCCSAKETDTQMNKWLHFNCKWNYICTKL